MDPLRQRLALDWQRTQRQILDSLISFVGSHRIFAQHSSDRCIHREAFLQAPPDASHTDKTCSYQSPGTCSDCGGYSLSYCLPFK